MPYSINIRSDHPSSGRIRDLWTLCERLEVEPSMASLGYPPHITLAVFDDAAETALVSAVEQLGSSFVRLELRFDRISHFETPGSLVLWAAVEDPTRLVEIHGRLHAAIRSEKCRSNYRPGIWVPHCSLATNVDPARRADAMAMVRTGIEPFDVVFDVVDCAHFHPVEVLHESPLAAS